MQAENSINKPVPGTKRMPVEVMQRMWKDGERKENRS